MFGCGREKHRKSTEYLSEDRATVYTKKVAGIASSAKDYNVSSSSIQGLHPQFTQCHLSPRDDSMTSSLACHCLGAKVIV